MNTATTLGSEDGKHYAGREALAVDRARAEIFARHCFAGRLPASTVTEYRAAFLAAAGVEAR